MRGAVQFAVRARTSHRGKHHERASLLRHLEELLRLAGVQFGHVHRWRLALPLRQLVRLQLVLVSVLSVSVSKHTEYVCTYSVLSQCQITLGTHFVMSHSQCQITLVFFIVFFIATGSLLTLSCHSVKTH